MLNPNFNIQSLSLNVAVKEQIRSVADMFCNQSHKFTYWTSNFKI